MHTNLPYLWFCGCRQQLKSRGTGAACENAAPRRQKTTGSKAEYRFWYSMSFGLLATSRSRSPQKFDIFSLAGKWENYLTSKITPSSLTLPLPTLDDHKRGLTSYRSQKGLIFTYRSQAWYRLARPYFSDSIRPKGSAFLLDICISWRLGGLKSK